MPMVWDLKRACILALSLLSLSSCRETYGPNPESRTKNDDQNVFEGNKTQTPLEFNERLVTILATNDLHGGVEPDLDKDKKPFGGMATWSAVATAIRTGLNKTYGTKQGVLMVDAGDQFQGTLISNYNEGRLVFSNMNELGYDGVVPGNHDYDFGPWGWLSDKVENGTSKNPREVIEDLSKAAKFPLLSANTYLKNSLVDQTGKPVAVDSTGCKPLVKSDGPAPQINWQIAQRPAFLKPYFVKFVGDVRVAMIGLDNEDTPTMTTIENVSDLCYRDTIETYREVREKLQGKADLFIAIIHNGLPVAKEMIKKLATPNLSGVVPTIHAVIAGHTHRFEKEIVNGVPIIQDGANGAAFGRIDLVFDTEKRAAVSEKMRVSGGINLYPSQCAKGSETFCSVDQEHLYFEGVLAEPNSKVENDIALAKNEVAPLANRYLGTALKPIQRDRINESALANALTDALRTASGAEIAMMNTGGIRADLEEGKVTYQDLFRILPFNNHGVVVAPLKTSVLLALLKKSIATCGNYGALMQSGLKVTYQRNCKTTQGGDDKSAQLIRVELLDGRVLMDQGKETLPYEQEFNVATLDFLSAGGSGYSEFIGVPLTQDLGIIREVLANALIREPMQFTPLLDNRWKNLTP